MNPAESRTRKAFLLAAILRALGHTATSAEGLTAEGWAMVGELGGMDGAEGDVRAAAVAVLRVEETVAVVVGT